MMNAQSANVGQRLNNNEYIQWRNHMIEQWVIFLVNCYRSGYHEIFISEEQMKDLDTLYYIVQQELQDKFHIVFFSKKVFVNEQRVSFGLETFTGYNGYSTKRAFCEQ